MLRWTPRFLVTRFAALSVFVLTTATTAAAQVRITDVAINDRGLRIAVETDEPVRLRVALASRLDDAPTALDTPTAAVDDTAHLVVPHAAAPDALTQRIYLLDADTGTPVAGPHWVTTRLDTPMHRQPMPWPDGIKGVSCPVGVDDLVELGIKHVHVNFSLSSLFAAPNLPANQVLPYTHQGQTFNLSRPYVAAFDREVHELTQAGINVVVVVTNAIPAHDHRPTVHPDADLERSPHNLAAFNLSDPQGIAHFVAGFTWLGERYTRPDARHGTITGYIVGNELDSHWQWHNMGPTDLQTLTRQHADELRLAWLAVCGVHPEARIFTSLTHSWQRANSADMTKNVSGRELLEALHQLIVAEGDFPWHMAYHPYPQNLFEPRWWDDALATFGHDTPQITFKNVEVLTDYLGQDRFLYRGEPRRIILSEQGVHRPDGPEGEAVQAAAFALAYERIRHLPIDAFILHRHVDHRGEFGLKLGLWTADPDAESPSVPLHRRMIWGVMQAAETDRWEQATAFAPAFAGWTTLADAAPRPGPFPENAPELANIGPQGRVAIDLMDRLPDATIDALTVEDDVQTLPDGGFRRALMLHPHDNPAAPGTITFTLDLPAGSPAFAFGTTDRSPRGNGQTFRVRINGEQRFEYQQSQPRIADHRVDLSDFAGQAVTLTLEVDPDGDASYDWAYWLTPAIMNE